MEENEKYENNEQYDYSRKNVDFIKKLILMILVVICAFPILFCMYVMQRINSLESKLEVLSSKLAPEEHITQTVPDAPENLSELDEQAYEALDKSTVSNTPVLSDEGKDSAASEEPVSATVSNGKKVYLTFDDGPSTHTDEILDILKANNVKATFFCIYNEDERIWPAYSRIVEEGHTLGMHSYSHVYDTVYADRDSFVEDVTQIHDFLYEQTGVDCRFYRFPGGSSNTVSKVSVQDLVTYLDSEGIVYFDWNALSGDAVDGSLSPEQLNANIMKYVRGNAGDSVVLMHDLKNNDATMQGLQDLLDTLKAEGYEICPIDENTKPIQHVKRQEQ